MVLDSNWSGSSRKQFVIRWQLQPPRYISKESMLTAVWSFVLSIQKPDLPAMPVKTTHRRSPGPRTGSCGCHKWKNLSLAHWPHARQDQAHDQLSSLGFSDMVPEYTTCNPLKWTCVYAWMFCAYDHPFFFSNACNHVSGTHICYSVALLCL